MTLGAGDQWLWQDLVMFCWGILRYPGMISLFQELLVNLELNRLVVYQVYMDLVGALRVWASREII